MEQVIQNFRLAMRMIIKRPGFSVAVILTLALGIGANSAIFTVIDAALLRGLPYDKPDQIVHLWETTPTSATQQREASYPDFVDWKANNKSFASMAGYGEAGLILNSTDSADYVGGGRVSAEFFDVLGVKPVLGRTFITGDDEPGAPRTVVLSHGLWQRRFGSDHNIVGKTIDLGGAPYTVTGVLPATFQFAPLGSAELFVPLNPPPEIRDRRFMHFVRVIGRLKDGITLEQAQADMNLVAGQISNLDPKFHFSSGLKVVELREQIVGNVKPILLLLLIAVSFVLLIACANVANLFLVRSASRQKEMAVRVALGASRGHLARQLFVESFVLSVVGGMLGVLLARVGTNFLVKMIPSEQLLRMPYLQDLGVDLNILLYSLIISCLCGLVFTFVPLFQVRSTVLQPTLKEGGRTSEHSSSRWRNSLVVAEIALTVILGVGVGLMLKSTIRLLSVDPGFDSHNLLTMRLALPGANYEKPAQRATFQQRLIERLLAVPGVRAAATTGKLPLSAGGDTGTPIIDGQNLELQTKADTNLRTVSATYFDTVGIPLVEGRIFSERDTLTAPRAIIVNQKFVNAYFPNSNPLNHTVGFVFDAAGKPWNIIGVVGNENVNTLDAGVTPVIYFPYSQDPEQTFALIVRTSTDPLSVVGGVREAIQEMDRSLPMFAVSSMSKIIDDSPSMFTRRYPTLVIGVFAALAMLLAAVGLYGVISYSVAQRTHELGVRIALGAQRGHIFRLVMGQGFLLAVIGVAVGLLTSWAVNRFLASLLFEVSPNDPAIMSLVVIVMIGVALLACYMPTLRASKVDPLTALRYE